MLLELYTTALLVLSSFGASLPTAPPLKCVGRCDLNIAPLPLIDGKNPHEYMMWSMIESFKELDAVYGENSKLSAPLEVPVVDVTGGVVACENGFAAGYPCKNIDLLSFLSHRSMGATTGNDIWGWTDPLTNKEYAIVCQTDGTAFVDVTDPLNPVALGRLKTHTTSSSWRDAKVYKDHAYIVSEASNHGVQVFDLTQLRNVTTPGPNNKFTESGYLGATGRCHNIAINEETGFGYCVGSVSTCNAGLHILDLSDLKNPKSVGCFGDDGYVHDSQVVIYRGPDSRYKGREIAFNYNTNHLLILDITDKSHPVIISRTSYAGYGYTHQGWLLEDHTYILMDDEQDEMRDTANSGGHTVTYIFNVENLEQPYLTSKHLSPVTSIDHNQYVLGDYSYQSNYASGLRVVNIKNIKSNVTEEAGFFDVHPEDDKVSFSGTWSVYPYFPSGNIVVNSIERGLFVVKTKF
ncbi:hypothetical protein HDU92_001368 [Lobulomyces angularis]|nr:hypothetical protein HDU92_001368 [Lobulomyces angularis]